MNTLTVKAATTSSQLLSLKKLRLRLAKLGSGRAISKMPGAIARAFEMAYLAPFSAVQREPLTAIEEDMEGRDPSW